jgi:hypothetical protein
MFLAEIGRSCRMLPLSFLLFLLGTPLLSHASLTITVYHNDAIYLASDSLATWHSGDKTNISIRKLFKVSDTCCAAIVGLTTHEIETTSGKAAFSLNVLGSLEHLCAEQSTNSMNLDKKIEFITSKLDQEYRSYFVGSKKIAGTNFDRQPTVLEFSGYNPSKRCFFVSSCLIDGTNTCSIKPVKEYRQSSDPEPIYLQGEPTFLLALLAEEKPELTSLVPPGFGQTVRQLTADEKIPDPAIADLILEMFQMHKENAARLGYNPGHIGPPYRIIKITEKEIVAITPDALSDEHVPEPMLSSTETPDDKAIDVVMDKLESSFKAGDYSYATEVIYTPIVEKMGGRKAVTEAATAVMAQAKQQHIVIVSWKVKKPYQYVQGESRTYAVIPYESVMKISGKTIKQTSYQLGIKNGDSHWEFVSGDSLTAAGFQEFFPDFPKAIQLPELQRHFE